MRRRIVIGTSLFVLASLFLSTAPLVSGTSFSPMSRVNDVTSGTQRAPGAAVGPDGAIHAVWADYRVPTDPDIYYSKSVDGGSLWTPSVRVTDPAGAVGFAQLSPAIAISDDGWIHVVWTDLRRVGMSPDDFIYYARSTDGGATFGVSVPVSDGSGPWGSLVQFLRPAISFEGHGGGCFLHVVWSTFNVASEQGMYGVRYDTSANCGTTFGPDVTIAPVAAEASVSAAANGLAAGIGISYVGYTPTSADVHFAFNAGQGWQLAQNVIVNDVPGVQGNHEPTVVVFLDPSVSPPQYAAFVAWADGRSINPGVPETLHDLDVYSARGAYLVNSFPFGVNVRVNDKPPGDRSEQSAPSLGVDIVGSPRAVWTDWRNDPDGQRVPSDPPSTQNADVYFAESLNQGATFSSGQSLTTNTDEQSGVTLHEVSRGGFVRGTYVAWTDRRTGDFDIQFVTGDFDEDGLADWGETFKGYRLKFNGLGQSIPDEQGGNPGVLEVPISGVRVASPYEAVIGVNLYLSVTHGRISDVSLELRRGSGVWVPLAPLNENWESVWSRTYGLLSLGYSYADLASPADWTVRFTDSVPGFVGFAIRAGIWADLRTNPSSADSDADGLGDAQEVAPPSGSPSDPWNPDTDGDSLGDVLESSLGTSPVVSDTDHDGLTDAQEVMTYASDPVDGDTDDDNLTDGDEIAILGSGDLDDDGVDNLFDWDSDSDMLQDGRDPDPAQFNDVDGGVVTWDAIGTNEALGISVGVDYTGSGPDPTIVEDPTPPATLPGAVGPYFEVTAGTGVVSGEIKVRIPASEVPDTATYYRLALYRYNTALARWQVVPESRPSVAYRYVGGVVPGFSDFVVGDTGDTDSDSDGLSDDYEIGTPLLPRFRAAQLSDIEISPGESLWIVAHQGTQYIQEQIPPGDIDWTPQQDIANIDSDLLALLFTESELEGGFDWSLMNIHGEFPVTILNVNFQAGKVHGARFILYYCNNCFSKPYYFLRIEASATTDPKNPDTDGDGLTDGDEVNTWLTVPIDQDTDDDYYGDYVDNNPWTDLKLTVKLGTATGLDGTDWWPCDKHDFKAWIEIGAGDYEMPDPGNCHDVNPENLNFWGTNDIGDGVTGEWVRITLYDDDDIVDDIQDIDPVNGGNYDGRYLVITFHPDTGAWVGEDTGDQCTWDNVNGEADGTGGPSNNDQDVSLDFIAYMNDVDGDCLAYREEVLVYHSNPLALDSDGDGMPDHYEVLNDLDPSQNLPSCLDGNGPTCDPDQDGLSNLAEFQAGTKARVYDTDGDFFGDGYERNSETLDPLDVRDGPVYSEEVHRVVTSLWHTLRGVGGLLDHERINQYFDDWQAVAISFFRELLLPDPEELPQDILIEIIDDISDEVLSGAGAAMNFGLAVDFYNDEIVVTSMRRGRMFAPCTADSVILGWAPGYIRILAVPQDCAGTMGQTIATLDDDRVPVGGISFLLKQNDELNYYEFGSGPRRHYYVHQLALAALTSILPLWGSFSPRTDSVLLPVLDEQYNEHLVSFPYTGFALEDQVLDMAVSVWAQSQNDFYCVGEAPSWPGSCPQRYGSVNVRQVGTAVIQVALKAYQGLIAARTFMRGIIDIDPLA